MLSEESRQEHFQIYHNRLGPLASMDEELEIRPLTLFIGKQGTGKSLVSQLLYFFREAPYLLFRYREQRSPNSALRRVIEGLRAGDSTPRSMAAFLSTGDVQLRYRSSISETQAVERKFSIRKFSKIEALQPFAGEMEDWFDSWIADPSLKGPQPQALFIPAERTYFSRFINTDPAMLGHKAVPLTMREFSRVMVEAGKCFLAWHDSSTERPSGANKIADWARSELRGEVRYSRSGRLAGRWQWMPAGTEQAIEIEMASSGQMESWPLIMVAQSLFDWGVEAPVFLHIEEPESHLHPSAQAMMIKILAFLVNHGFRIVVTTHSLDVLYALNNLIAAEERLPKNLRDERVPSPEIRLSPEQVGAYHFKTSGEVQNIMLPVKDISTHWLNEDLLRQTEQEFEYELNRIRSYGVTWGLD
ncbi:MAG: AAA family ATPase [Chloroflexota bacterium]|nr:AAA family ATPase [Chloroflexota bacterium]